MAQPIPKTAADALDLWKAGEIVLAFRVESEGADQEDIYAQAFAIIEGTLAKQTLAEIHRDPKLTDREHDVAASIATVALTRGWAVMVHQHVGVDISGITIQKAK